MRIKLDENLGDRSIELFRQAGHDTVTVEEQNLASASDGAVIHACRDESRALITPDLDFSNVLVFPPTDFAGIAVLRTPHPITRDLTGKLWIVESERIREYASDRWRATPSKNIRGRPGAGESLSLRRRI